MQPRGEGPPDRGVPEAQAARALGRSAAARRDGARDRARAAGLPDGRAAVEPRREAARADARRDPPAAAAARRDDDLRHARPGRGDDDGRPRRRHERRAPAAGRHAAGALRPAGQRVRRGLHRLTVDQPRRGAARADATATSRSTIGDHRLAVDDTLGAQPLGHRGLRRADGDPRHQARVVRGREHRVRRAGRPAAARHVRPDRAARRRGARALLDRRATHRVERRRAADVGDDAQVSFAEEEDAPTRLVRARRARRAASPSTARSSSPSTRAGSTSSTPRRARRDLALDRACGQAGEDPLLQDQRDRDQRQRDDHRRRHDLAPRHVERAARLADEGRDRDRHRVVLRRLDERERVEVLVPGGDEREQPGRDEARARSAAAAPCRRPGTASPRPRRPPPRGRRAARA